jgi:hypothetical protein
MATRASFTVMFLVLVLAVAVSPLETTASVIEHALTGQITESSILFPGVLVGDPFAATLRYDSAQPPIGVIGSAAFYTGYTFEVAADGLVFPGSPSTALVVENDGVLGDRFVIDGVGIGEAGFFFEDASAEAFDSIALPSVLDLAQFDAGQIVVVTGTDTIRGEITSISTSVVVPEPHALLLLLSGVAGLGAAGRLAK